MSHQNIINENILANTSTSTTVLIVDTENPPGGSGGGSGSGSDSVGYNPEPPSDNEQTWQEVIPNYTIAQDHQAIHIDNTYTKPSNLSLLGLGALAYFVLA